MQITKKLRRILEKVIQEDIENFWLLSVLQNQASSLCI